MSLVAVTSTRMTRGWQCPDCGRRHPSEVKVCVACRAGVTTESGRRAGHSGTKLFGVPSEAARSLAEEGKRGEPMRGSPVPSAEDPHLGQVVERWRLVRCIGRGGFGAVYLANHVWLMSWTSAIKILGPAFVRDQNFLQRFQTEAELIRGLDNTNIVRAEEYGVLPDGSYFIRMELARGEPLDRRVQREGSLSVEEVCFIAELVLKGLSAAHAAGVIHRDLKPANIMVYLPAAVDAEDESLASENRVKIIDFGIAKNIQYAGRGLTMPGVVIGTPPYMAPELWEGDGEADPRSDIYALGVIMYEMLTGSYPFSPENPDNPLAWRRCHANSLPGPPCSPHEETAEALQALVLKALEKNPEKRHRSARDMLRALQQVRGDIVRRRRPRFQPPEGLQISDRWTLGTLIKRSDHDFLYLAEDTLNPGNRVVVRMVVRGEGLDEEAYGRYLDDIRIACQLGAEPDRCPNLARYLSCSDVKGPEGTSYGCVIREYLPGDSLSQIWLEGLHFPREQAQDLCRQLLRGLAALHQAGIIHRSLSPASIFFLQNEERLILKIVGLGLSLVRVRGREGRRLGGPAEIPARYFQAPELLTGSPFSFRADVFSAAAICYQILTDRCFFEARSLEELAHQHTLLREDAQWLREQITILPKAIRSLFLAALSADPNHRPADGEQFAKALILEEDANKTDPLAATAARRPLASVAAPAAKPSAPALAQVPDVVVTIGGILAEHRYHVPLESGSLIGRAPVSSAADETQAEREDLVVRVAEPLPDSRAVAAGAGVEPEPPDTAAAEEAQAEREDLVVRIVEPLLDSRVVAADAGIKPEPSDTAAEEEAQAEREHLVVRVVELLLDSRAVAEFSGKEQPTHQPAELRGGGAPAEPSVPDDAGPLVVHVDRALAHLKRRELREALAEYLIAIDLRPEDVSLKYNIMRIKALLENQDGEK